MITLTVTSFKGNAVANPPVSFDELGGTIGRADTNQLVLPDPERTISRIHAQVVFRNGAYALIGRGGNAVLHNGTPVGHGAEVMLAQGDQIVVGGYHIAVSTGQKAAPRDPFEAEFGGAKQAAQMAPPAAKSPAPNTPAAPRPASRPAAPAGGGAHGSTGSSASSGFGIPDDWDPFAKDAAGAAKDPFGDIMGSTNPVRKPAPPGAAHAVHGIVPAPQAAREDSLDALFGLSAAPPSGDPFAKSALGSAPAQPNTAGSADPLRALQQAPQAAPRAEQDHVSDLNAPWVNARPPAKAPAAPAAQLPGAVLSWDVSSRAVKIGGAPSAPAAAPAAPFIPANTIIAPSTPRAAAPAPAAPFIPVTTIIAPASPRAPEPAPAAPFIPAATTIMPATPVAARAAAPAPVVAAPMPAPQPVAAPRPAAAPEAPAAMASGNLPAAGEAALLDALREGLGTPDLRVSALTPELMRQVGELLRESTKGTVELLAARAALKREVRADVTTILASANNSLKFSPSVEVALQYLLGPKMMGFMPPVESMRDAYDDLKAHQLGVMAGMKAALAGVLERFDPKVVEGKLTSGSALSSLLPSSRKARLWELFQELYQKLATEAEEDFNTLFGAAFLKAYQQYIDQLEGRDGKK